MCSESHCKCPTESLSRVRRHAPWRGSLAWGIRAQPVKGGVHMGTWRDSLAWEVRIQIRQGRHPHPHLEASRVGCLPRQGKVGDHGARWNCGPEWGSRPEHLETGACKGDRAAVGMGDWLCTGGLTR